MEIAIFGAGGFGREVKTIIDEINKKSNDKYRFIGFFDDGMEKNKLVNNFSVLGGISELNSWQTELSVVLAIGSPATKAAVLSKIVNPRINFPTLVHPNTSISDDFIEIGKGCIICEGTILTCNIKVGDFVIFNLTCTVGHDSIIGDNCSFMPGVNVSGEVNISAGVYVGTGAKIINQVEIGPNTIVGAGAVVSKSLPGNCTAVGVPAKPIKFHQ